MFAYILLFITTAALSVTAQLDPRQIYDNCGTPSKRCFGDEEGCIQNQNCTFVTALTNSYSNPGYYIAEIQNNCNYNMTDNLFIAIGAAALEDKGDSSVTVQCLPSFEDFKFLILWSGKEKCPDPGKTEKKWGKIPKDFKLRPCKPSGTIESLEDFANNNVLVKAGNGNVGKLTQNANTTDGTLYITVQKDSDDSSSTRAITTVGILLNALIVLCLIR